MCPSHYIKTTVVLNRLSQTPCVHEGQWPRCAWKTVVLNPPPLALTLIKKKKHMYVCTACVNACTHICMPQYTRGGERTNLGELVPSFHSVDSGDQTQGLGDKHPLSHLITPSYTLSGPSSGTCPEPWRCDPNILLRPEQSTVTYFPFRVCRYHCPLQKEASLAKAERSTDLGSYTSAMQKAQQLLSKQ